MTLHRSLIAAAFLSFAAAAQAGTMPTTADEARALAARTAPAEAPRLLVAASTTPATTDEARALASGAARAEARPAEQRTAAACGQACACKHG